MSVIALHLMAMRLRDHIAKRDDIGTVT